jgi:ABC transporter ATM
MLLRSITRASLGHGSPLLLSRDSAPRFYRLKAVRGYRSTSPLFLKGPAGLNKGLPKPTQEKDPATHEVKHAAPSKSLAKASTVLGEPTLGAREQRKADWGIIKEMSQYLWPKVGFLESNGFAFNKCRY